MEHDEIIGLLLSRNGNRRDKAIKFLLKQVSNDEDLNWAIPHLVDAYFTEWFDPRRMQIVLVLGEIQNGKVTSWLYEIIIDDNGTVGSLYRAACGLVRQDRIDLLIDCLKRVKRRSVLEGIITALGESGRPEAIKSIAEFVEERRRKKTSRDNGILKAARKYIRMKGKA